MKTFIIDTNAILRFLLNDIPSQHKKVESLVKKAKNGNLIILLSEVVVFETLFALRSYYQYSKETLLTAIEPLISTEYIRTENTPIFLEAIKIFKNTTLEFVDCFLIAKSKSLGFDLFTFDKKLNKYAKNS